MALGEIVGIAVGGFAAVTLVVAGSVIAYRRRSQSNPRTEIRMDDISSSSSISSPPPPPSGVPNKPKKFADKLRGVRIMTLSSGSHQSITARGLPAHMKFEDDTE
eukprot:TRINITY_DN5866_c0_g1_i1.p1 TRINITY_DN5866_c0_g1~~TRINITY_DN5866_c0_g1_i1.p1  ORF type:complete len:105 (-),score=30.68 TRINITY_DN5866_c0_g1_i1:221-535(-)